MNKKSFPNKVQNWCDDRGWTDLFVKEGVFYAFPPQAVIPVPVTVKAINYG